MRSLTKFLRSCGKLARHELAGEDHRSVDARKARQERDGRAERSASAREVRDEGKSDGGGKEPRVGPDIAQPIEADHEKASPVRSGGVGRHLAVSLVGKR